SHSHISNKVTFVSSLDFYLTKHLTLML
ncbi:hypothetical protein, partial [Staphylococcus aureus]